MGLYGVDCDEVLMESVRGLAQYAYDKYGHVWPYEDFLDYFISNNPHVNLTRAESIKLFDEYFTSEEAKLAKPVDGARAVLEKGKSMGHTFVVVTGRNALASALTYHQMDKHYPNIFDDVIFAHHFTDNHVRKSDLCKALNVEGLIDDLIDSARDLSSVGIPTFLLKKPWNQHITEEHPLIHKVNHRSDITFPSR